jgi:hypothetical protein
MLFWFNNKYGRLILSHLDILISKTRRKFYLASTDPGSQKNSLLVDRSARANNPDRASASIESARSFPGFCGPENFCWE